MKTRLQFSYSLKILSRAVCSVALLFSMQPAFGQTITNNTQGTHDGYFYSFWNDGQRGSASMTLGPGGNYSTTWTNINNFTAGKGWKVGKPDRTVCFEGSYNGGSNGFLAVYGWTKDPLIEYYVVESYGQWTPPGNTSDIIHKGSFNSDDGTYNIYVSTRTDKPSIIGNATFQQYWSVRTTKRSTGTVTFKNHVDKWRSLGMNMGTTWDYQIMESEGYQSTGSSNITVEECSSCSTPAPTVPSAVVTYEQHATATQLTATGTNLKWYTVESGGTALSSAPTPNTTNVGTTIYYVGQTQNNCEGPRVSVRVNVINTYKIFKVSSPITIDGTRDPAWSHANVLAVGATKLLSGTVSNTADLSGNAKVLWDDSYIYLFADVSDESKVNESANVYDDDGVEFYVDINNNKATTYDANDVQYTFGWDNGTTVGVLPTGRSTTGITYSAVSRTGGYIVEARIPWTTLQGSPAIGQLLGMDFMINDDDDNGERDGKLSWNAAEDNAWQDPSLFGTAILQGLLPCTTPATPTVNGSVTYCQQATATALTATGTGLVWYTSAAGGAGTTTAPVPLTASPGTTRYYVSQNINGCESARAEIEVTVNALPSAPATTSSLTYCQNAAATVLTATGNELKWYTQPTNGTALAGAPTPSTIAAGTTNYYVSQTTNGCESPRTQIAVIVNANPEATISASGPTTFVEGDSVTLQANAGSELSYKWYKGDTQVGSAVSYTAAESGSYSVEVTNTFDCKAKSSATVVTANPNKPSEVIITSPAPDVIIAGAITISANISDQDGEITKVEFMDGTTVISTITSPPYNYIWENPPTGEHSIIVRVTDSNGGTTIAGPIAVISGSVTGTWSLSGTFSGDVYPNPTTGEVFIASETDLSNANVSVIDVLGNETVNTVIPTANGLKVELKDVKEGIYVITIKNENSILRKKITVKK